MSIWSCYVHAAHAGEVTRIRLILGYKHHGFIDVSPGSGDENYVFSQKELYRSCRVVIRREVFQCTVRLLGLLLLWFVFDECRRGIPNTYMKKLAFLKVDFPGFVATNINRQITIK